MTAAGRPPTCLVVQHVEPEGPYTLGESLALAGIRLDVRRVFLGEPLPADLDGHDALVVMGGPMSAGDDAGFPALAHERALLAEAISRDLPTLGICLGAQLLALAAGGAVFPGTSGPEIGWAAVTVFPAAADDPLFATAPGELGVLHWHGDTFSLPQGALLLASSATYANQAFRIGTNAWGLQFHVEVDEAAVKVFVTEFEDQVLAAGHDPQQIADATPAALEALTPFRDAAFAVFARRTVEHHATTPVVSQTTPGLG